MIVAEQLVAKVDHRRAIQTTNRKVGFLVAMINSALISCFYLRVPFIKITKLTESKHFLA